MVHPDAFGEDGGRSSYHSDLENQWLQVAVDYDEDTGDQNGKSSTLPYPLPLLNNHGGPVWQPYRYDSRLIVSRGYWYLWMSYW